MIIGKVICSVIIFIPLTLFCWESPFIACLMPYLALLAIAVILVFSSWYIGKWCSKIVLRPFSSAKRKKNLAVLVTGCDRGLGQLTAIILNRLGYYVFASCFSADQSSKFIMSKVTHPTRFKLIQMDVTDKDQVISATQLVDEILRANSLHLHGLINNAGIATFGGIEYASQADVTDYQSLLDVNVLGTVSVTRAFLPLIRRAKGRIIIISSIMARLATPGSNAYSVSKAALSKFAEGLQLELTPFGVHTITIEPWLARTEMFNPATVTQCIKASASSASTEVKSFYGKEYHLQLLHFNQLFAQFPITLSNEYIVEAIDESLSSPEPEAVYRVMPGLLSLPIWFMNDLLAWEIITFMRRVTFWTIFQAIWILRKLKFTQLAE